MKKIEWFKGQLAGAFRNYELKYKSFSEGDFGALDQVEFNTEKRGGIIDFWSMRWLGIFLYNYVEEKVLLNTFLEPHQHEAHEKAICKLMELI
jgi:hypothetical protein